MKIILHVDQDQFYAAIEARDNPFFRNKSLIIGSLPHERGVVATCSYEARKFGVRSAMNIKDAYRLCQQGIFMHPNFEKYKRVSRQLHEIWKQYTEIIEYVALDEAYLDLSNVFAVASDSWSAAWNITRDIAQEIKLRTKTELALTCSVGLGYSMTSAKLASEEKKPDGYFEIPTATDFLNLIVDRDIRVLYGVGKKTAEKLNAAGLHTVRDIQNNREKILRLLGNKIGQYVADLSVGIDNRAVTPYSETDAKSIAREVTFQKDTSNFMFLKDVLMVLSASLESRLQRLGFYARTVTLKLTHYNMKSLTRSVSGETTNRAYEIFMTAFEQLRLQVRGGLITPVRLIGISLQNISVSGARQLTFDDVYNHREEILAERWERAIRGLERKYDVKLVLESRERLYDIISSMEQRKI